MAEEESGPERLTSVGQLLARINGALAAIPDGAAAQGSPASPTPPPG